MPIFNQNGQFWLFRPNPKMDLGLEIEETKAGIRISILQIHCVPVFSQNGQFWLFLPNLSKNGFRFWNSENQCRNKNQHAQDTMCTNFQAKHATLTFCGPNLPKNGLNVGNRENKCMNKNNHPRDNMCANFWAKQTNLTVKV